MLWRFLLFSFCELDGGVTAGCGRVWRRDVRVGGSRGGGVGWLTL